MQTAEIIIHEIAEDGLPTSEPMKGTNLVVFVADWGQWVEANFTTSQNKFYQEYDADIADRYFEPGEVSHWAVMPFPERINDLIPR